MFVGSGVNKSAVKSNSSVVCRSTARRVLTAAAFMLAVSASSTAVAQNCDPLNSAVFPGFSWLNAYGAGIAGGNAIAATISATNTAFLTHSSAFVSAPPNAPPDSQGGGVWVRGVGGASTIQSAGPTTFTAVFPGAGVPTDAGAGNCSSTFKQTFGGVQLGADVAKLNVGGWNFHLGTTIGYMGTRGTLEEGATPTAGSFDSTTRAPFVGTYAAATYGGFFVEGLLRFNYYEVNLNSPSVNIYDQKVDAHGYSLSGSAGYHYAIPNSTWFVEPSAGAVWSRTKVDPLQLAGVAAFGPGTNFQGTTQINDINSLIGRAGVRVGSTFVSGGVLYQPFVAASIWHEFRDGWSGTYTSCTNCIFLGVFPGTLNATMGGNGIGTYGVYSVGLAGQIVNTGWLGYARFDFEDGSDIRGWTASAGLRYQFTPEAPPPVIGKVKAPPIPIVRPVSWTGFYIGGFGGVTSAGKADADFDPRPATANTVAFPGVTTDPQLAGVLGGAEVGYNHQMGQWVLGVELDAAWTNTRGSLACGSFIAMNPSGLPANALFNSTCHDQLNWLATATARLGYAWGRALYYVKGGGAWTHEEFSVTCNLGPINPVEPRSQSCRSPTTGGLFTEISASDNRFGWTAGFGVQFALTDNWSAKAETNFVGFPDHGLTLTDGTTVSTRLHMLETKVGVDYRFGPR
jgi:opacity protein-like surface antigen